MTSKERVLMVFEQREPDRVPCWMGASPSHDYLLPETPVENVLAFYEAVRDFGGY
jgi:uroporphyrinogen-III decarboxylase